MNMRSIQNYFMNLFRPARAQAIGARFPLLNDPNARVLDVGGGSYPWDLLNPAARVTILNKSRPPTVPDGARWEFVIGDGTSLEYPDRSFDLVFSNSVIEHVGDLEAQTKFANEMRRVGKHLYCQTPNRWFPVEPHLIALIIHWFPSSVVRRLARYGSVWGWATKPNRQQVDEFLSLIRLLSFKEFSQLYPDCDIRRERVFGLTKSFIAERIAQDIDR